MMHNKKEQRVKEIAYLLWEKEGSPHGAAERHWVEAEALYGIESAEDRAAQPTALESATRGDIEPPVETKAVKAKAVEKDEPKAVKPKAPKAKVAAKRAEAPVAEVAAAKATPKRKPAGPKGAG